MSQEISVPKLSVFIAFILAIIIFCVVLGQNGCGKSAVNNELIGQVKKVQNHTPIICPNYVTADISLGFMQNGGGSYSNQDIWVVVPQKDLPTFQKAVETGQIVKVKYDIWRVSLCNQTEWATSIEFLNK